MKRQRTTKKLLILLIATNNFSPKFPNNPDNSYWDIKTPTKKSQYCRILTHRIFNYWLTDNIPLPRALPEVLGKIKINQIVSQLKSIFIITFFFFSFFFYSVSIVTRHTVLVRLVIIAPESIIHFFCTGYIHSRYIWFLKTSLDKAWQTSTLFLYSVSMPINI